jgi:uncharacterized protein (TIGR03437 family)
MNTRVCVACLLPVFLCPLLLWGQVTTPIITTAAGTPWIFPSSSVAAVSAPLGQVQNLTADGVGNVYLADLNNSMVMRVSQAGTLTVVAGNGFAGFSGDGGAGVHASLDGPQSVSIDASGNLYIADTFNNRIRKLAPSGIITTIAGNGTAGYSGDGGSATGASLYLPTGVATDTAGNVYVADYQNNRVRKVTPGGTISTVAGNGVAGFSGDGGPATRASLSNPANLAIGPNGTLYIADFNNNRVRAVSPGGTITTIAGNGFPTYSGDGGAAAAAGLSGPVALALDATGNLFIADDFNNRIRKVTTSGLITTVAGSNNAGFSGDGGQATSASLNEPDGITVDSAGNLYLSDQLNERVRKVSPAGTITTFAGNGHFSFSGDGGQATSAALFYTSDVTVDANGNLYVVDYGNNRVRRVATDGTIATVAGNGIAGFSGDGGPATSAELNGPSGAALDGSGNLYVADTYNHRIRRITPSGIITTFAGNGAGPGNGLGSYSGDGGAATNAGLNFPYSVALDSGGNVYIADWLNERVRKVSSATGVISTVAGNGTAGFSGDGSPATNATLNGPTGLAVDSTGNLYISDSANARIRRVSLTGTITSVAGNGSRGFSGDGGPATNAGLNLDYSAGNSTSPPNPAHLMVDSFGNLYIPDNGNNRIREVSPNGRIVTIAGTGVVGSAGDGGPPTSALLDTPTGVATDSGGDIFIGDFGNSRVREILGPGSAVSFLASPATLSFTATAGGATPGSQAINLSSTVPGLSFTVSTSASWLSVSPSASTLPLSIQASIDPTSLPAGTYQGTITVVVPNAGSSTTVINVTAIILAGVGQPKLSVATPEVSFNAIQASGSQSGQIQVLNSGIGSLAFTAAATTASGGGWLSATASGTATPSAPGTVTVVATPGSLAPGTYTGTVTISGDGTSASVPITLAVTIPTATILLSQNGLTFTSVAEGTPLPQTFGILNSGQGSMSWTITASTLSGGSWLQVSAANGVVQQPNVDVSLVNVSVVPGGLNPGTYYGSIQVSAPAINTPESLTVILTVLPSGSSVPPDVQPSGLIFTGVAGVNPGSQDVLVGSSAGQPINFNSQLTGTGITYLPRNAQILPGQPVTLHVYPDFSSLSPGVTRRSTVTLQFPDGTTRAINVLVVVAPPGATPSAVNTDNRWYRIELGPADASGCSSEPLQVQNRSLQANFAAVVGQSIKVDVQVTDGCGNLVTSGDTQAQVMAYFSDNDPQPLPMAHLGNGIWEGSWKPVNAASSVLLKVTATVLRNGNLVGGVSPGVTGVVKVDTAALSTPTVTAKGVVHAATDQGGVPIAPGGLITIFGSNLADGAGQPGVLPLPGQFNGAKVLLGDKMLPILYTSAGQLNVQVPYTVPVDTQYQITVQHDNTLSVPESLVVAAAQPGIFTTNQQGTGQGSIVKSDQVTLAQPGTPAAVGETIVIYCTGLGAVSPKVTEGNPAPATPLSSTVNTVTATIGGKPAPVTFSGLTPFYAGLYQLNTVVPSGIATGDAVPVVISVAGQTSPPVTMAVR